MSRTPSAAQSRREYVKKQIRRIYDESYQNYGARKIARKLNQADIRISERTVGKYMREMGIKAQWVRPWTRTTLDSDPSEKLHNILNEQFNPKAPNAAWCSDITYIWTDEGFVYLTSIMDLFSRKIVAWTLSKTLETEHVIETVRKAQAKRDIDKPLVIHSDRGRQYVSKAYLEATADMLRSYSHRGYPYDNACIESFHAIIKREWLRRFRIRDFDHAYRLVFEYIEAFYNTVRIHSHCNYLSPDNFEKLQALIAAA